MKKLLVSILVVATATAAFMMLTDYTLPIKQEPSFVEIEPAPVDDKPVGIDELPEPVDVTKDDSNDESPSDETSGADVLDVKEDDVVIEYFGIITVQVVDENNDLIINQPVGFFEGDDDLIALLKTEFTVYCGNAQYEPDETCEINQLFGRTVLGIDDVLTDWYHSFMAIYINDTYSFVGVDSIEFVDGDVIRFDFTSLG